MDFALQLGLLRADMTLSLDEVDLGSKQLFFVLFLDRDVILEFPLHQIEILYFMLDNLGLLIQHLTVLLPALEIPQRLIIFLPGL